VQVLVHAVFVDHEYEGAALPHTAYSLMSFDRQTQVQPVCMGSEPAQHLHRRTMVPACSSALAPLCHALAQLMCFELRKRATFKGSGCMPMGRS